MSLDEKLMRSVENNSTKKALDYSDWLPSKTLKPNSSNFQTSYSKKAPVVEEDSWADWLFGKSKDSVGDGAEGGIITDFAKGFGSVAPYLKKEGDSPTKTGLLDAAGAFATTGNPYVALAAGIMSGLNAKDKVKLRKKLEKEQKKKAMKDDIAAMTYDTGTRKAKYIGNISSALISAIK